MKHPSSGVLCQRFSGPSQANGPSTRRLVRGIVQHALIRSQLVLVRSSTFQHELWPQLDMFWILQIDHFSGCIESSISPFRQVISLGHLDLVHLCCKGTEPVRCSHAATS